MSFFARGVVIGLAIAAPVGPIGVLCIKRSISAGRLTGLLTGLGAATADAFYGAVAAFGLTTVANSLTRYETAIRVGGGAFLIVLGIRTFMRRAHVKPDATTARTGLLGAYGSALVLTLTNVTTILSFAAVYASIGIAGAGAGSVDAAFAVAGVFTGSALWWVFLSAIASRLGARLSGSKLKLIDGASAALLVSFGFAALISAAR